MIDSAFITQKLRSSGIFGTGKDTDYAWATGTLINGQPETVTKKIGHTEPLGRKFCRQVHPRHDTQVSVRLFAGGAMDPCVKFSIDLRSS